MVVTLREYADFSGKRGFFAPQALPEGMLVYRPERPAEVEDAMQRSDQRQGISADRLTAIADYIESLPGGDPLAQRIKDTSGADTLVVAFVAGTHNHALGNPAEWVERYLAWVEMDDRPSAPLDGR